MALRTTLLICIVIISTVMDNVHANWNLKLWKVIITTMTIALNTQVSPIDIHLNSSNINKPIAYVENSNSSYHIKSIQSNSDTEVGLDITRLNLNSADINTYTEENNRKWTVDSTKVEIKKLNQSSKVTSIRPILSTGHSPQSIPLDNKLITPYSKNKKSETTLRLASISHDSIYNRSQIVLPTAFQHIQILNSSVNLGENHSQQGLKYIPSTTPTIRKTSTALNSKSWAQVVKEFEFPSSTSASVSSSANTLSTLKDARVEEVTTISAAAVDTKEQKNIYSSNPTFSKGNTVTDKDLEKLSEALFIKDTNNAFKHIKLNLQKRTSSSNQNDEAPEPLLTVDSAALLIPTIQRVIALYDNYQLDPKINEYISSVQREEENLLINTFLSTNVMSMVMRFLADKGFVRKDYHDYRDTLRRLWFNLYSRGEGKIGSAGFEHVFLTEVKLGTEISGLHNWIYFNAAEVKEKANYLGYLKKLDLGKNAVILKLHAKFNGIDKPVTTMFIGTSPELEMALYTVCYFSRPNSLCPLSLGGTKFNIRTYKFKYRGKELIGSAYPEI